MPVLRQVILAASRSDQLKSTILAAPITRSVVDRFVAGEAINDVVDTVRALSADSLLATVDHLGEDVHDIEGAAQTTRAYTDLLAQFRELNLGQFAEVSVKLSAVGQALGVDGAKIALDNARTICQAAANAGTTVTLDMEDHTTTDSTLGILRELRQDFPWVGAVLQAYLYRTEADVKDLAYEGSRVRLCKGAYREPESVAYQSRSDIDRSYVRCMRILMNSDAYPMLATHDPRLIEIAGAFAVQSGRAQGSYEYQMLHGVRPEEQKRLAHRGEKFRVYVPYGTDWYGYLMRRMAEKPANLALFLRSLVTKS